MTAAPETTTSDLDLLDDPLKHARCMQCQDVPPGVPFTALCGRRAVGLLGITVQTEDVPPGVQLCPDCLDLYDQPCRRCAE